MGFQFIPQLIETDVCVKDKEEVIRYLADKLKTHGCSDAAYADKVLPVSYTHLDVYNRQAGDRVKVFADIGPIMEQKNVSLAQQYQRIADVFLAEGAECFLFETLLNTRELHAVSASIKQRCPSCLLYTSRCV